ncbi:MAG TPA: EAL domain-containing protein [Polyangiaceae bacterium]|nr:EAL domain-containing protein [Polyangiaceae bacterium]
MLVAPEGMVARTLPDTFRVLVIDDARGIHEDIGKILGPAPARQARLEEMEETLLSATRRELTRARFRIDSAFQGEQGIACVERALAAGDPYALAFVDVLMPPGLDGIDALAQIWRIDPHLQAVICTAHTDHTWDEMVQKLGRTDRMIVLRKPFDSIEVLQVAHALAYKWALARQTEQQLAELEQKVLERTQHLEAANAQLRREIQSRQKAENDLRHLAMHDVLTGMPNRILFRERLERAILRARRHEKPFALMLLDLDNFKDVNDVYGHAAGDELLCETARRLSACIRACDTVARLGGDEFVLLLEDLTDARDATLVAERVLEACSAAIDIGGHRVRTPPSIGVATYPSHGADADTLLKSADLAMYDAKRAGRATYRLYAENMKLSTVQKLELRERLERALGNDEFRLWFQPLIDLGSGTIVGMEALLRWEDPVLGMIPPLHFIPAAEAFGLMIPIGQWVLRAACRQLAAWDAVGLPELTMAVNVSPHQLRDDAFPEQVQQALLDTGLDPTRLELEITESAAMDDIERAAARLARLSHLGVRVVIDDFGSGYSSLVRLKELPIDALKIDRMFVKHIVEDRRDAAIVMAIVAMAHSLGIQVVAEGIETEDQLDLLRKMPWEHPFRPACQRAQGFLFGRPSPAQAAAVLIQERAASPSMSGRSSAPRGKTPSTAPEAASSG